MPFRETHDKAKTTRTPPRHGRRKTIPAREVDFTLTISKKAMKEIDRIEEKAIKAAQDVQKFAWG